MALDAAALALCAKELSAALADARIDKIFEPTRDEVVLNLRTRTDNPRLFLSARSGSARACLTKETFENPQTPPLYTLALTPETSARSLAARFPETIITRRVRLSCARSSVCASAEKRLL